ncbi:MAG: hypothetical protein ACYTGX_03175 [Planctomycetota bacterium]
MRRAAWALLGIVTLAGCGDAAMEADLASTRAGLADALVSARLAEIRIAAQLYLDVPGDVADLQAEIALLHRILEVGTEARARAAVERQQKDVEEELARARLDLAQESGGPGASAAVATPRLAAAEEAAERARLWRDASAVAERRADAIILRLQEVAAAEAPSQREAAAVLRDLAALRAVVESAFGAAEGDVGFSAREQLFGLETKLAEALGDPAVIDPESDEPLPAAVTPGVRAAADAAVGALKFCRRFSLPTLAGTQLAELLRAALRPSSGWLAIAARSPEPAEETAERVAALLGAVQTLRDEAEPALEGLDGWRTEVARRGLTPARVRAIASRMAQWFPDAAVSEDGGDDGGGGKRGGKKDE